MSKKARSPDNAPEPWQHCPEVRVMVDNEILLAAMFLGTGLLAYVIIPGLLVIWDRVLDYMGGY